MGRISGLAFDQIVPEYRFHILGISLLDQETRKVHAADQMTVAGTPAGTFKTAMNAEFVELRRDIAGAHRAPIANGHQPLDKFWMLRIYVKADDMHGLAAPA